MALSPGTSLGHYNVTAFIGEGGMGQVWQATDTQLGRQVALNVLLEAFTADPGRLTRLERKVRQSVWRDAGVPVNNSCWRPVAAGD